MSDAAPAPAPVALFRKGKARTVNTRKRSSSPTAAAPGPSTSSTVVLPTRKSGGGLLSSGTKRSRAAAEEHDDVAPEERGLDVHWAASGSASVSTTAREILDGDEAEEILRKRQKRTPPPDEMAPDDGQYRGLAAYGGKIKKQQEVPKSMRVGPQRASGSTIRTVTIVDYQPDVCKDYKETGYCGFGDTCKFLHDRGTYLAGWQLDQIAANPKKAVEEPSDSDSDEDIPFACLICRKPYTDPIVTRCKHYFCSACAIKRFAKTPKCIACGAPTGGMFNRADKVIAKMEKKRKEKEGGAEDGQAGDAKAEAGSGDEEE